MCRGKYVWRGAKSHCHITAISTNMKGTKKTQEIFNRETKKLFFWMETKRLKKSISRDQKCIWTC